MNTRLSAIVQKLRNGKIPAVVRLAAGELTSNEAELRAQWRELTHAMPLAQSTLHIRIIRAEQQCMTCFEKYHPEKTTTRCPRCGGVGAKILAGEELYLESIEEEA